MAPTAPAPGVVLERLSGEIRHVTIDDRVAGLVVEHYALKLDDGTAVALKQAEGRGLGTGDRVEVSGRRNGKLFFASTVKMVRPGSAPRIDQKAKTGTSVDGTLALLHADDFDSGRSDFIFEVHDANGDAKRLDFAALPDALQPGMRVRVTGTAAADDFTIVPATVVIFALPGASGTSSKTLAKAVDTNNVLVILMTFTDSGSVPFAPSNVQNVVGGGPGTGSVGEYFKEVSYGQQLLNVTVTNWLATGSATPANCNWKVMGQLGRTAAATAGYPVSSYQNLVYVFPQVSACGWIGLGYVGSNGVWINGRNTTQAYSHELGHNFGLLHAGSVRCSAGSIGGSCSVTEYGDPFDVMGNISSMHFNASQKFDLAWIPPTSVQTHTAGAKTYFLNPLETAGGALYAIKIPAAANRTYWLEYRQPVGFDSNLGNYPNAGAQIRVASPFETMCFGCDVWSNDTQLLDMTPGTSTFLDSTLLVGNTFTDDTYGVSVTVLAATSGALQVQVSTGGEQTIFSSDYLFVAQQYRDFLAREGSASEINAWVSALGSGISRAKMIDDFVSSAEYQNGPPGVIRLFFASLARPPQASGLLYWRTRRASGDGLDVLAQSILDSSEFKTLHPIANDSAFVDFLFGSVLRRVPSANERNYWITQLTSLTATRAQLLATFTESTEYIALSASQTYVSAVFLGMLARPPASSGLQYWTSYLQSGKPATDLITSVLTSTEYATRF